MTVDGVEISGGVKEEGYISCMVKIGEDGETFQLILDTGSPLTIVPCGNCQNCGNHAVLQDPHLSRFARRFDIHYVEGSRCAGKFIETTVSIHSTSFRAQVGCANVMTKLFRTQHADGIMGLDANSILKNFMVRPEDEHENEQRFPSFALRLNPDHPEQDRLLLGVRPEPFNGLNAGVVDGRLQHASCPMFAHTENFFTSFRSLDLSLSVGKNQNQTLTIRPRRQKLLIDSGTTHNYFEAALFQHIKTVLQEEYGFKSQSPHNIGCVRYRTGAILPNITLRGADAACQIVLKPHQWSVLHHGHRCAAIHDTGIGNDNTLGLIGLDYRQTTFVFANPGPWMIYMEELT